MSGEITCFTGENGEGKTNLLDAIFYLCIGKSYFHSVEKLNRQHNSDFLRISGNFIRLEKNENIVVISQNRKMKRIERNQVPFDKVSSYLGFAPVCFIAPNDSEILLGGSEMRRKFINTALSQMNRDYLLQLIEYKKIIQQRNALLKQESVDLQLLTTYDEQLIPIAESIYQVRQSYLTELSTLTKEYYALISQKKEQIQSIYSSQLNSMGVADGFANAREKDILLKRSTFGIHRDDIQLLINDYEIKKVGSQGQQKTTLLSLKLAEFTLLSNYTELSPILLLDDIFDKLDINRIDQLFKTLTERFQSQIFLTDTNPERLKSLLQKFNRKFEIYIVNGNQLSLYEN